MDPNSIQAKLAQKRQEYGQRVAELPSIYKQYAPESDREISGLRSQQSDKLKQLFEFDNQVAQRTYQPIESAGPYSQGYTPPTPRVLDPTIGLLSSSQQKQATAGELADISTEVARRKDYLAGERDKALTMLQMLIQSNKDEQSSLEKELERQRQEKLDKANALWSTLSETGGDITPDLANILGVPEIAGRHIPTYAEKRTPTQGEQSQAIVDSLISEIQKGRSRRHLLDYVMKKYSNRLSTDDILYYYNIHSPHGQAIESPEVLQKKYQITPPKDTMGVGARDMLKKQTGIDVIDQIEKVDVRIKEMSGTSRAMKVISLLENPAAFVTKGLVTDPNDVALSDLESKYFLLVQSVLTAIQGSRPSDYDVKSYQRKSGPNILNSPQLNKARIKTLLSLLESSIGKEPQRSTNTKPSLESFIVK